MLATLAGTITDPSGGAVTGATVEAVSRETGSVSTAKSGDHGEFVLPGLAAGAYEITFQASGFRAVTRPVDLLLDQHVRVNVELVVGLTGGDQVVVMADRPLLRTENAALGAVVENAQVTGLPLDGRNWTELALLVPGAVPSAQGSAGSVRGNVALSLNGGREDSNNFLLDGVYNGNPNLNGSGVVPAVDAIREFEVVTSNYDASFGRNGAGQVNVVLKSGTNALHGAAYEFFRNAALDSTNYFAPANEPKPKYQRNQFGAAIGGPVVKNRTFVFADFESRRTREGITRVTNVPTALERTGDFSQSGLPYLLDPFTFQPFPGNKIPSQRLHPTGVAVANLYPLPNRNVPGQNYVSSPTLRDRNDQFDVRLDHKLGARSDLAFRYSMSDRSLYEPFTGPSFAAVPGYGDDVPRRTQNVMASHTHAFTPTLLNEFRAGFNRNASSVLQENRDKNISASLGLPVYAGARANGLTYFSVPGYSPLGDEYNNPQMTHINTFQALDQASWIRGRHHLKFGFDFRRYQQNAFRDIQARGLINFVGYTGNALSELLQGLPAVTGIARVDNPQYLRGSSYNAFVNDTWRAAPKLTLTLGVRYEFNTPPHDRYNRANLYDVATQSLVPVGTGNMPRAGYTSDRNNFAPRIGLAYTLGSRGTTVVRAGYGFYYDQNPLAPGEGLYFNAPYYDFRLYVTSAQFPLFLHDPYPANYPFPSPPSSLSFQRDLRTGYLQHWNFGIQHQLGSNRVAEVAYAGSKGTKLLSARDINQPDPSPTDIPFRPNFLFSDINQLESRANSNYHSLQTRFQQRLSGGISALASYTWSKSIDDASSFFPSAGDANFPQDSRYVASERARSSFDVAHRFTAGYTWELPFAHNRWYGGWQTNGIWSFQTGRPFTVALLSELDNSGTGRSSLGFGANDRPNVLRNAALDNPTPERWFDTSAFVIPAKGSFGNAGRNILNGPGQQNINVSLLKNFALSEAMRLQFRLEAFNLLNHTNFDLPNLFVGSPTFGRVSSAQSPRHLQLGLKLLF
ncbi:MAG: TonB-dependent receptor [Acidobacteriota bacterium]